MLRVTLFLLCAACVLAADLSKPIDAIGLPDGRILRNAQITAYRTMDVTVKHAGGLALVRYEFLPEDIRIEAEKKRPGGPRTLPGQVAAKSTKVSGQVFITTRGAGAYKFSGVAVYAFSMDAFNAWAETNLNPVPLPPPLAETKTDGDGKFTLLVPKDTPFFIFAQASRMLADGATGSYEWRAPSSEFKRIDQVYLESQWRHPPRPVKIEKLP